MGQRHMWTEFQAEIFVDDSAHSHRGQTMVTLEISGEPHHLFPEEARKLAQFLGHAAAFAEGTAVPDWAILPLG